MTLKALREYFDSSGKLIQNLSGFSSSLPFYGLGDHIDNWLYFWYGSEKALDNNFLVYLNSWLTGNIDRFTKLYNSIVETYNPLENYRMNEEHGRQYNRAELDINTSRNGTTTTTTTPASVTSTESRTTDDGLTLRTYAQNSTTYGVGGTVTTQTETGADHGVKSTNQYQGTKTLSTDNITVSGNEVETTETIRSGNIGVTTSQQMLSDEINIRVAHSFIKLFCEVFERECLTGVF